MGRPSNTEERRRQIVEATVRVMAQAGYDGASVQAIAKEAGLSPGLLHHHFSRKRDILFAVLEHLEAFIEARERARSQRRRSAWGRLQAWVEAHLALGEDASSQAAAVWVWLGAQALRDPDLRERYAAVVQRRHARLCGLIEAVAQESGARVELRGTASAALAMVEGYYVLASNTDVVQAGSAAAEVSRWLQRHLEVRR